MRTPIMKLVYDRKKVATPTHEASVELRVTCYKTVRYYSTGVRVLPKQWKNGVIVNRVDSAQMNETLDKIQAHMRKTINAILDEGEFDFALLDSCVRVEKKEKVVTFIEYCYARTQVRIYGKKEDTAERYYRFLKWLKKWGKIVTFADVTDKNIIAMDEALSKMGMKECSKWHNYHRFMKSYILDAIEEGHLKRNPYKWVHIAKGKSHGLHKYLTLDELHRLERTIMPTKSLERVRDLFVFQAYTCLSYTDMEEFDADKVVNGIYTARRNKTGQEFSFLLLKGAQRILEKYDGRLPMISNVKYNGYLKVVAQTAKIDKPLTSHWARHTGATILLNEGVNMETVARILGHSSTKETRNTYAKLLDTTIADEMMKVERRIEALAEG